VDLLEILVTEGREIERDLGRILGDLRRDVQTLGVDASLDGLHQLLVVQLELVVSRPLAASFRRRRGGNVSPFCIRLSNFCSLVSGGIGCVVAAVRIAFAFARFAFRVALSAGVIF